jgi:hypothetical protein
MLKQNYEDPPDLDRSPFFRIALSAIGDSYQAIIGVLLSSVVPMIV